MRTKTIKGWVGFSDGKLHVYKQPDYYFGTLHADFFETKEAARVCYEDVRRATLTVEVGRSVIHRD